MFVAGGRVWRRPRRGRMWARYKVDRIEHLLESAPAVGQHAGVVWIRSKMESGPDSPEVSRRRRAAPPAITTLRSLSSLSDRKGMNHSIRFLEPFG